MTLFDGTFLAPLMVAGGAMFSVATAGADTIAHWRFEEGNFLADSSGNGHHLAAGTTASTYALPGVGAGSKFHDPIPQTGDSNGAAMQRSASDNSYLAAAYDEGFASNAFTIEAMVNVTSRTGNGFLAGRWSGSSNSSYAIQMKTGGEISLILKNATNSATISIDSGFTLALDTDYYLAVVVDLTGATPATRSATFYLQNLTSNGQLSPPTTVTGILEEGVRTEEDTGFSIGAQATGGNGNAWAGVVDEVRYSNAALSPDQFLAVPEPGTVMLLGLGGLFLIRRHASN